MRPQIWLLRARFPLCREILEIGPRFHVVLANFLLRMRRNGHISTSGQIFNPKFEISMGCFLFKYEFWWHFRQDLYVFCTKNGFCNAKFSEFKGWWGWGWPFFDETPKRHILGRFHAFWAIIRANPFMGFCSIRVHEKKGTLQKVTERLYFTYLRGIPHPTKFNQNWHTSRGRRRNQSHQVW